MVSNKGNMTKYLAKLNDDGDEPQPPETKTIGNIVLLTSLMVIVGASVVFNLGLM